MTKGKKNLQAMVPADHRDRVRNTVWGMQRNDPGYTLTRFLIEATEAHCRMLEERYNEGQPWPQTGGEGLQPGARITPARKGDSSRITPDVDEEGTS